VWGFRGEVEEDRLGLSGLGLTLGAIGLLVLRAFCLKILGRYSPEAAAMVGRFAVTMVCVGVLQSLAYWALASRWTKTALLFGGLGIGYWFILLAMGQTPAALLHVMPLAAGAAFAILLVTWLVTMQRHHWPPAQS